MANVPVVLSFNEIQERLIRVFVAQSGVNDLNKASAIRSILESAAMSDFRVQASVIAALNSIDVDRTEESDLDAIGIGLGVTRPQARAATGSITAKSLNFTKVSTKVYAGTAAPPAGSNTIDISSADGFPTSGAIYIGRGSNNLEGPISYSSITPVGNFYRLNLATLTVKNHNVNESVILAQGGNRLIKSGTVVQTKENSTTNAVQYTVLTTVTIPDGEDTLNDIPVVCTELGTKGNVAAGAIVEFATEPYPASAVENLTPFVTGSNTASDVDYRLLIKQFQQNKTKGTDLAIKSAAIGVSSQDDNKTVASAEIRKPADREEPATLFIDDGSLYQPIYSGQGFEYVIENANGGEKYLQLQHEDITKALLVSQMSAPFDLTGGMQLAIKVGGVLSVHNFGDGDFLTQNAADTSEVVNSINANDDLLFSARPTDNSRKFLIQAKSFKNEDLEVVAAISGVDANDSLGLSESLSYSLRLYKNDELLIKDGQEAFVYTRSKDLWQPSITSGYQITLSIDQQSSASTYTFVDADFVPFGFASVSINNSIDAWASVFNAKIPGITATAVGNQLKIASNKGASSLAKLNITGGNLAVGIFDVVPYSITGKSSDYALNRSTGQIELATPLVAGDNLTAGSKNTRAFLSFSSIATGTANIPASPDPKFWILVDDILAQNITHLAISSTDIAISHSGDEWTFTSNVTGAFTNVEINDWMICADQAIGAINSNFIGYWRVTAKPDNQSVTFRMSASLGTDAASVTLSDANKLRFIRSSANIQEVTLPTGLQALYAIATYINPQMSGAVAEVVGGKVLKISSNTYGLNGAIMVVDSTVSADVLGMPVGTIDTSTISHTANVEAAIGDRSIPTFFHTKTSTADSSDPYTDMTIAQDLSLYGITQNDLVSFLNPYGTSGNNVLGPVSSNDNLYTQFESYDSLGNLVVRQNVMMDDILVNDRFYVSQPLNFGYNDSLVVIFDGDGVNKTANVRLSRKGQVNNVIPPTATQFTAYDADAGATANFPNQFGNDYDFSDYKLQFQARQILDPAGANNKMLLRAVEFGPSGNNLQLGIEYPQSFGQVLTHVAATDDKTSITVMLASGPQRLGGNWDNTTQFSVTNISTNVWRYNYLAGTAPNFLSASIVAGDIVNIDRTSNFAPDNTGSFKVVAASTNYFDVFNLNGVAEAGPITLNYASDFIFFPLDDANNTAASLALYADNNLSNFLSIEQMESGAGVINTSTFDDSGSQFVTLVDGENYVKVSNIGTTIAPVNQFTLKNPISLPSAQMVGEDFYIIPTRSAQLAEFLNIFAVSSISSFGNISTSTDGDHLQFYSNTFGTSGSVQISGGTANSAGGAIEVNGAPAIEAEIEVGHQGAARTGTTVVISTKASHNVNVGNRIVVSGVRSSTFNGEFTATAVTKNTITYIQPSYVDIAATSASRTSNVVQLVSATAHNLTAGDKFTLTGAADASFDGTFLVTAVLNSLTVQYNQVGVDASTTGGTMSDYQSGEGLVNSKFTKMSINQQGYTGIQAGQWIKISNTATQAKDLGFGTTTQIKLTRDVGNNQTLVDMQGPGIFRTAIPHSATSSSRFKVEQQGDYVAISHTGTGPSPDFTFNGVNDGDTVILGGQFSAINQGTFRIMKVFGDSTIYIENVIAEPEELVLSAASDITIYTYDSVLPKDTFRINSDVLGSVNEGVYEVKSVTSATQIVLTGLVAADFNSSWTEYLLTDYNQVEVIESTPFSAVKYVSNASVNTYDSDLFDIVVPGTYLAGKINEASGSSVSSVGKLSFPTSIVTGEDSYKYYQGLISAVGKTIRGQAEDPISYPGVQAAGAYIEITSPLPRRIQISIVVKNLTGIPFTTIKTRIQSAVAAYINSLGVAEDVIFSQVVAVVQELNGVQALAVSSPTYDQTNLLIAVNEDEKAVVYNATDVVVSLAT